VPPAKQQQTIDFIDYYLKVPEWCRDFGKVGLAEPANIAGPARR
jgi:hypothetical protein|tara:strand:- start:252 stop:383 length:132 start_codon:yes stop_codon:yes gene_type:complete